MSDRSPDTVSDEDVAHALGLLDAHDVDFESLRAALAADRRRCAARGPALLLHFTGMTRRERQAALAKLRKEFTL